MDEGTKEGWEVDEVVVEAWVQVDLYGEVEIVEGVEVGGSKVGGSSHMHESTHEDARPLPAGLGGTAGRVEVVEELVEVLDWEVDVGAF